MKADWFIGDLAIGTVELSDENREALKLQAKAFLLGGGSLSWERWAMLSEESRQAFSQAGIEIRDREAAQIALYMQDRREAIRSVGGEDAVVRAALEDKLEARS